MPYRRAVLGVGIVALTAGGAGILASVEAVSKLGTATVLLIVGVMILGWSGLAQVFHGVTKPADDAYKVGYEMGFSKGFIEGHKSARPVVVPMASASTCLQCDDRNRREDLAGGADAVHP